MSEKNQPFPKKSAVPRVSIDEPMETTEAAIPRERFVEDAIDQYQSQLIGYATTLLHDVDRARDVVQDTFIRLCNQEPEDVAEHLKTWLFTVCRNRAFDILRKDKRLEPINEIRWKKTASPDESPDRGLLARERYDEIMQYLARLPENQRECILLKFQQGLSYHEIEKVTGLKQGNIGFLIHTGLKRVRAMLPADMTDSSL
jgi:RNA polymerase sigma factor (sigma-70 family)